MSINEFAIIFLLSLAALAVLAQPIKTTIGWDGQPDASVFSVVANGATNLTTWTNYTLETPLGTNRIEIRAHSGTLSSEPFVTNILVSADTIITHWPETSGSVLGPWTKRDFGSVTNPVESVLFVRVGQSTKTQTNRTLVP